MSIPCQANGMTYVYHILHHALVTFCGLLYPYQHDKCTAAKDLMPSHLLLAVLCFQCKAAFLDDDGKDLSEFLPEGATQQLTGRSSSPGAKRPRLKHDISSSSSDDDYFYAGKAAEPAESAERKQPQVIFCSRTHSQLSQFVGELHRTHFASSILMVAVASRKALCVNDQVR